LEMLIQRCPHNAVHAVSPNNEIVIIELGGLGDSVAEAELNALITRILLHELQQLHAADAHETIALKIDLGSLVDNRDAILKLGDRRYSLPQFGVDAIQYVEGNILNELEPRRHLVSRALRLALRSSVKMRK
jgi:hypothetical protein